MSWPQSDHLPELQGFFHWLESQTVKCQAVDGDGRKYDSQIVPVSSIRQHFDQEPQLVRELRDLVLGADHSHRVYPETILNDYPISFCILLSLNEGRHILSFAENEGLLDKHLPFTYRPEAFPAGDPRLWESFYQKQWEFCAAEMTNRRTGFADNTVLPFLRRERLGQGVSATIDMVEIHKDYDKLQRMTDEGIVSAPDHIYAVKTYRGTSAKSYFDREVDAFNRLADHAEVPSNMIGFYGSYKHRDTYNIILEYAHGGNLEEYMRRTTPPVSAPDILAFWRSLMGVTIALCRVHEQQLELHDPDMRSILCGWHQDIKPANILVVTSNGQSRYEPTFKLADLGLSHFTRGVPGQQNVADQDTFGTRTYGAPERYAWSRWNESRRLMIKRSTDIWSFGCVASEVAVWVVEGWEGVEMYRARRKSDVDKHPDFRGGNCFHNGERKRASVNATHRKIRGEMRLEDITTGLVLDQLVEPMLNDIAQARPNAAQLMYAAERVISKATEMLSVRDPSIPSQSRDGGPLNCWRPPYSALTSERTISDGSPRTVSPVELRLNNLRTSPDTRDHELSRDLEGSPGRVDSHAATNYLGLQRPTEFRTQSVHIDIPPFGRVVNQITDRSAAPTRDQRLSNTVNDAVSSHSPARDTGRLQIPEPGMARTQGPLPSPRSSTSSPSSRLDAATLRSPIVNWPIEEAFDLITGGSSLSRLVKKFHEPKLKNGHYKEQLKGRDHVFVIDDSGLMEHHWTYVLKVFEVLIRITRKADADGIDLYFVRDKGKAATRNGKAARALVDLVRSKEPQGRQEKISAKYVLEQILDAYGAQLEKNPREQRNRRVPPLSIYVFTDGCWNAEDGPESCIERTMELLDRLGKPFNQIGIQFVSFGQDRLGLDQLQRLDRLGKDGRLRHLEYDIVDTEPYNGDTWKMLLGAIDQAFDDDSA